MSNHYEVVTLHAYAPHGQLDKSGVGKLNDLAAKGWRIVAATGWTVILERPEESP